MSPWQVAQTQMTHPHPHKFLDLISELVKHAADLPVDSLTQDHSYSRCPNCRYFFHSSALPVECHPGQQLRSQRRVPRMIYCDIIFLFDLGTWMSQALCKIAVVRQNQKPFGLRIKSANVEKSRKLWRQKIEDCVTRIWIGSGRNEASRFIQHYVDLTLASDQLSSDFNMVSFGWLRAEVSANATIDGDASSGD